MNRKSLSVLLACGSLAAAARGDVLRSELFDYSLGESLAGKTGGAGFDPADAWNVSVASGGATGESIVPGLTFSDFPTTGNAYALNSNYQPAGLNGVVATRRLGGTSVLPTSGDIYVSFLMRSAVSAEDNSLRGHAEVSIRPPSGSGQMRVITKAESWDGATDDLGAVAYNGDASSIPAELNRQQTYLVVATFGNLSAGSDQAAKVWFVSEANYDAIKADGITPPELDANNAGTAVDYSANITLGADYRLRFEATTEFGMIQRAVFDDVRITTSLADLPSPSPVAFAWKQDAGGTWHNPANWSGNVVPNGPLVSATLGPVGSSAKTVVLDAAVQLNDLTVDAATGSYTIDSPGTARLSAASLHVVSGQLSLDDSTVSQSAVAVASAPTIDPGASLRLLRGSLVIDYSGASPLADVQAAIIAGRITTDRQAVGVVEATSIQQATFGSAPLDSTALVLFGTLRGDSDLDGTVNFDDLLALATNYNQAGSWANGDSNYDGTVNFDDLLALAANYNQSLSGSLSGDWALAQAAIPEPTSVVAFIMAGAVLRRRR